MNSFSKIKALVEIAGQKYDSGVGYTSRVVKLKNKHIAKFFKDGKHMSDADYEGQDEKDAHEFARDEMAYRKKEKMKNESVDPKDHIEQTLASADINSEVKGDVVKVHKSNKSRAERLLKKMGHTHKVETGLNEETLTERIHLPQGTNNTTDKIADDAINSRGRVKKMMGNRSPLDVIARILAGRGKNNESLDY